MSTAGDCELPEGARIIEAVSGGDINRAFKMQLADGRLAFVKARPDVPAGEYAGEADGLRWLAAAEAISVPDVIEVGARFLALQWIEPGRLSEAGEVHFGRGLANLHASGAGQFGDFTAPDGDAAAGVSAGPPSGRAAAFGSLALSNAPLDRWPEFYVQRRLVPLIQLAAERAAIGAECARLLERICSAIDDFAGPDEPPARLHGDLWQGNVLADQTGEPWLVDPSAYGGHREMDLAMLHLFGRPSRQMFAAYQQRHPLSAGWQERMPLWQLSPLLVHAVLFGAPYGDAVQRAAAGYLR